MPPKRSSFLLVFWAVSISTTTSALGEGQPSRNPDGLSKPYRYVSLKGLSDEEIVAFMREGRRLYDLERAARPRNRVPEGFWTMDPRAAALALVEANRSEAHRGRYRIEIEDAGDGPAMFVILVAGFLVVGGALIVEILYTPPYWLHAVLWGSLAILVPLVLLRSFKGVLIALQFRHKAEEGKLASE